MNNVQILGRLTREPVMRTTTSGTSITSFSLAVPRERNKDQVDYIDVVTWRGLAETCAKYLIKGQQVAVTGELRSRKYTSSDNKSVRVIEVYASSVDFLAKPQSNDEIPVVDDVEEALADVLVDDELPM